MAEFVGARERLLGEPQWIESHVARVASRFCKQSADAEDLKSQAVLYVLEGYNAHAFNASLYPILPGESEADHQARVMQKLKAHAGISIVRHLRRVQKKRHRLTLASAVLVEEDFSSPKPEDPEAAAPARRARVTVEKLAMRCRLTDDMRATICARVIDRVLGGEDPDKVLTELCPGRARTRLLHWIRDVMKDRRS